MKVPSGEGKWVQYTKLENFAISTIRNSMLRIRYQANWCYGIPWIGVMQRMTKRKVSMVMLFGGRKKESWQPKTSVVGQSSKKLLYNTLKYY